MKEIAIILFAVIGGLFVVLSDKEINFRIEKELLKANQVLSIMKVLAITEIVLICVIICL